jgi:hypothetical protein
MSLTKGSFRLLTITIALLFGSSFAMAQDDDEGPQTQGDDAVYVSVTMVDYKPGMRADALEIIAEHFAPAGEASETPGPVAIHFQTGEWDAGFLWQLEGGMKDLEWYRSPNNIKWMDALAEQEGSMEAAEALYAKYISMISRSLTNVGHRHVPQETEED